MGNICGPRKHDTIITSFPDHMIPIDQAQQVNEVDDEEVINMPIQREEIKQQQQPKEHQHSTIKSKLASSHISSLPSVSNSSQVQSMQKAIIIPPSQIGYDKIQSLQLLSQVPSSFFNQCSMSKYFIPTNSRVESFNNSSQTQSKVEEVSGSGNSPKINFYLKPLHNEFNNINSDINQRHSRSQLKETNSTDMSNETINFRRKFIHNTII